MFYTNKTRCSRRIQFSLKPVYKKAKIKNHFLIGLSSSPSYLSISVGIRRAEALTQALPALVCVFITTNLPQCVLVIQLMSHSSPHSLFI